MTSDDLVSKHDTSAKAVDHADAQSDIEQRGQDIVDSSQDRSQSILSFLSSHEDQAQPGNIPVDDEMDEDRYESGHAHRRWEEEDDLLEGSRPQASYLNGDEDEPDFDEYDEDDVSEPDYLDELTYRDPNAPEDDGAVLDELHGEGQGALMEEGAARRTRLGRAGSNNAGGTDGKDAIGDATSASGGRASKRRRSSASSMEKPSQSSYAAGSAPARTDGVVENGKRVHESLVNSSGAASSAADAGAQASAADAAGGGAAGAARAFMKMLQSRANQRKAREAQQGRDSGDAAAARVGSGAKRGAKLAAGAAAKGLAGKAGAAGLGGILAPIAAGFVAFLAMFGLVIFVITLGGMLGYNQKRNENATGLTGNAALLANFLMNDMGLGEVQAAAIIGNSVCETYNGQWRDGDEIQISFSTEEVGGEGIGFMQFTDAEEKQALFDMAAEMGKDWTDPDVQLRFFKEWSYPRQWITQSASIWAPGIDDVTCSKANFENEGTAGTAALMFMGGYLRPAYSPSINHYPNRMAAAEAALRAIRAPRGNAAAILAKAADLARSMTYVNQYVSGGLGPAGLNWSGPKAGSEAWGGTGGFGCSTFVSYVYETSGIGEFGGSVTDYYYHGARNDFEEIDKGKMLPGDLVVYGDDGVHMAIWLGDGLVAESTNDTSSGGPGIRIIEDALVFPDLPHHYIHYSKLVDNDIVAIAETQLGVRYLLLNGGYGTCRPYDASYTNPASRSTYYNGTGDFNSAHFDCYGFSYYCWTKAGYSLSEFGDSMWGQIQGSAIYNESQLVPGALIHYTNWAGYGKHWAIYIGGGRTIHAIGAGVQYGTLDATWAGYNPPA